MPAIKVREGAGRVIIYKLDSCGVAQSLTDGKLVLDSISEFGWEDVINDGDEVTERNFAGKLCYTDTGANELKNIGVNLTACGINPAIDAFLMGSETITNMSDQVTGFGRRDLNASLGVAIEVMIQLEADACDAGATAAPVATWLFPLVKNWKPAGGSTLNGTDLVKPQYSGQNYRNSKLWDGTSPNTPADLAHWDGYFNTGDQDVANNNDWYAFNIFDGADIATTTGGTATNPLPTASDEPVDFTV